MVSNIASKIPPGSTPVLQYDPERFKAAIKAFEAARDKVDALISNYHDALVMKPMAGDPVSDTSAGHISLMADACIDVLVGYRTQLDGAIDSFYVTQQWYENTDLTSAGTLSQPI